jgi:hypothetical protein
MSDKSTSTGSAKEVVTGKANGMPFDKFDEKIISWGRMKYGERYAKALWRKELVEVKDLNLDDDLDKYKFDENCSLVNDVIACESPKYAASLLNDKRFATLKWQVECRYRFHENLFVTWKRCVRRKQGDNCKRGEFTKCRR